MENVMVVGASANEERYSHKAMQMLEAYGHNPIPVSPATGTILGRKVYARPCDLDLRVDTVTMYVAAARQDGLIDQVAALKPKRVIFNPGTENPGQYARLQAIGTEVVEACTLVMLKTGQF